MKNKDWWTVEKLKIQERHISTIDSIENLGGSNGGDFGSYRKVLKGIDINETDLRMHNDLNSKNKIRFIHKLISINKDKILDVLDVGCGMGFTTHELGKFYSKSVAVGVDISNDAISYAKKKFVSERFICQAVDPNNPHLGLWDLIFCFEFYPFSRTESLQIHKEYLRYFLTQLKNGGKLILHQKWGQKDSINRENISTIVRELSGYTFDISNVPHYKIINVFKFNYPSLLIDKFLRFLLNKDPMKVIIISKK